MENTTGNATLYDVIDKETRETFRVTQLSFGNQEVIATTEQRGDIVFSNEHQSGNLQNDRYEIVEVTGGLSASTDMPSVDNVDTTASTE